MNTRASMMSPSRWIRRSLSRFVPQHVNDPFGLVRRMLASRKRAALFTLWLTGLGILLTPVDLLLQAIERVRGERSGAGPAGPVIIVCGPARSGATLVYQVLAANLDVAYVRNFTTMFSRSPVLASRLFTRRVARRQDRYENYYGKTSGMQAPSEANHLWNQWIDADSSGFRTRLTPAGAARMRRFMSRFSRSENLPLLCKNTNANAFADTIDEHLDDCYFICLRREPVYLAQSLLRARREINGDVERSYGVVNTDESMPSDPVAQVVGQVRYLDELAEGQQARIGRRRFWIVDYERFCRDPGSLVRRVRSEILGAEPGAPDDAPPLPPFENTNRDTDTRLLDRIREAFRTAAAGDRGPRS